MNKIETWIKDKLENKDKSFWAKILGGVAALVVFILAFAKYKSVVESGNKAKLENNLASDDSNDLKLETERSHISDQRTKLQAELTESDKIGKALGESLKQIKVTTKTDKEVIDSINSFDDIEKKVK